MGEAFTAADILYPILIAGALAMTAFAHKELRAARQMLGWGAVIMSFRWLTWAFLTDAPWFARAIVGAMFGALLLAGTPAFWRWSVSRDRLDESSNLNYTVSLNCISSRLPSIARADRALHLLQIINPPANGNDPATYSVGHMSQIAGDYALKWDTLGDNATQRCSVVNNGGRAISRLRLDFHVLWLAVTPRPDIGGTQAGALIAEATISTDAFDLGPHPGQSDYVFFNNNSDKWIYVTIPTTAIVTMTGSQLEQKVDLIQHTNVMDKAFVLWPRPNQKPSTNPQAAPPLTPIPQLPPAGK